MKMQMISDCRLRISDCRRATRRDGPAPFQSAIRNAQSAFTLVELLVAMGLMTILLTMIATIFFQAAQSFRMARAGVEIYRNADGAMNIMRQDLAAAEFCTYGGGTRGYFAIKTMDDGSGNMVPALTFTTLASQPGARYAAGEAVQQLALVRYTLQLEGTSVTMPDKSTRPRYNLVKQVRFPAIANSSLNMDEFNLANLGSEHNVADTDYAIPEPMAFNVLSMRARLYLRPGYGQTTCSVMVDGARQYLNGPAWYDLESNSWTTLSLRESAADLTDKGRPAAMVEITLEMSDHADARFLKFTNRFYVPASEH